MASETLRDEISNDPLSRGYSAMTASEVASDLNTEYRERNVQSLSGDMVFQQTDGAEYAGLSQHERLLWNTFTSRATVDPWNGNNEAFVVWIFGSGSTTVDNLKNIRVETVSRAVELGLGSVLSGDVAKAREQLE